MFFLLFVGIVQLFLNSQLSAFVNRLFELIYQFLNAPDKNRNMKHLDIKMKDFFIMIGIQMNDFIQK